MKKFSGVLLGCQLQGYRAQIDRKLYKQNLQTELKTYNNLEIQEGSVENLLINQDASSNTNSSLKCEGVILGISILWLL